VPHNKGNRSSRVLKLGVERVLGVLAIPRHNLAILLNGGDAGTEAVVEGLERLDVVVRKLKVEDVKVGLGEGWGGMCNIRRGLETDASSALRAPGPNTISPHCQRSLQP
jgi:hypothetical protein